ncbi:protein PSP1 superfamily [Candidatus Termititenax persephonae]|uniref:Protein PSP1 superfamily n=1 Tax=Candidatus Termititenax persephonae TaxID=2218525 RepID=A0A388TGE2_9BACT|nr:protein PSP1 superfamily [Candidatus Termititenax persephonae]
MTAAKFALKLRKHVSSVSFELRLASFFIKHGDLLVAETNRGEELARAVRLPVNSEKRGLHEDIRILHIVRRATAEDLQMTENLSQAEQELLIKANAILARNAPDVKLISVELLFSRKKAFFYYRTLLEEGGDKKRKNSAPRKTNPKEIQRFLHQEMDMAVEVREMGGRSCAYAVGGLGHCGCGLCCTNWLRKPLPVSVKMAKEQNLSVNIPKLSGVCGKLMCCLGYELEEQPAALK